jgi:hypothetical protein
MCNMLNCADADDILRDSIEDSDSSPHIRIDEPILGAYLFTIHFASCDTPNFVDTPTFRLLLYFL